MLQENPFIPYSFVLNVKRIINKTKATGFQWRYDEEIKNLQASMKKDNNPKETPAEAKACYSQIIQIIKKL
ncbi:hypothetical protein OXYTRIMIC_077 [Oxytricha trifallax]|uniref:Uncharacterized protein n=1 Tax=Oxytricha trifallax TaxID=1172189 RepID=A0A073HYZ9_9SPIT|nr:hypothetical protein OXYTRIMIC_077 [Oxytricha trifallax]